jgi:hypothetical protein
MHCGFAGLVMIVNFYIGEILEGGVVSTSGMSNDSSVSDLESFEFFCIQTL